LGPEAVDGFDEAEAYCSSQGRHLVSIHDATEQAAAEALCDTTQHDDVSSHGCWIGLKQITDSTTAQESPQRV